MIDDEAVWHDVECGCYAADLPVWRQLTETYGAPVLDLGCGTGRVALDLAAHGHVVVGLDAEPKLTLELGRRAKARDLPVTTVVSDARAFTLSGRYPLAIAPMQVVQLLGGRAGRAAMLANLAAHLAPGGVAAFAVADPFEDDTPDDDPLFPLPDVLEIDGWVLASHPVALRLLPGAIEIDRVRQAVSPAGELAQKLTTITLEDCTPDDLETEGAEAGFEVLPRIDVAPTPDHVGSTIVILQAP